MLVNDIDPIGEATADLFIENSDDIIDKIIELPLRTVCKLLRDKGIETLMSSANRNNVLEDGVKPTEKEDLYGTVDKLMENHYFTEAGNGYAWIMLNYNSLSDENKRILFDLEQTKDIEGNNIGEKIVWFVHPFEMNGNIEYGLRTGKLTIEYLNQVVENESFDEKIIVDKSLEEFDRRNIILFYPWTTTTEAVFLRMPINKYTTVEEVENYFVKLAELFNLQEIVMNRVKR